MGTVVYRPGSDPGLDHFFGGYPSLPLGGEGEGWVLPFIEPQNIFAVSGLGIRRNKLNLNPEAVQPGAVIRVAALGGLFCFDESGPVRDLRDDLAGGGLRSWVEGRQLSGAHFVEVWSEDDTASFRSSWADVALERVLRLQREPADASAVAADEQVAASMLLAVDEAAEDTDGAIAYIHRLVAAGESADRIAAGVDVEIADLEKVIADVVDAHRLAQQDWPAVTDCERLDAAFVDLEADGIVARRAYGPSGGHESGEVRNEIDEVLSAADDARGCVYVDDQDIEIAVNGLGVWMTHSPIRTNDDEGALAVGRDVVATLTKHGLTTTWDETPDSRIRIAMPWQHRR